jgi:pimeloyl-ACP methyl ester carboxylesterase
VQLVGNSFGGTIALSAALLAPERVASLALIEANPAFPGWGETIVEDLEDLVEGFDGPGIRGLLAGGAPRKLRSMVDRCEELVTRTSLPDDLRASRHVAPEDLAAVHCPTLLLYGDASDILDRGIVLDELLPDRELRIVEGCSHALLMEAPDEAAAHVVPWLVEGAHAREKEPAS